MGESSHFAKLAAALALRNRNVDEEVMRILLALNDREYVARLLAESISQGKFITPEAISLLAGDFRASLVSELAAKMANATANDDGKSARQIVFLLYKLNAVEECNRAFIQMLEHSLFSHAAALLVNSGFELDSRTFYKWLRYNSEQALPLADELERQSEGSQMKNGKRDFIDRQIENIRSVVRDNATLRRKLEGGTPKEISDALWECSPVTSESIDALDQFAFDHPERVPELAKLILQDAANCKAQGYDELSSFYRFLADKLSNEAKAAEAAALAQA